MSFDSDRQQPGWPTYSLVTIPVGGGPLVTKEVSGGITVPKSLIGGEYNAAAQAEFLPGDNMRHLLSFGMCGLEGRICLDVETLAVLHVPTLSQADINPVNANLELFSRCVEMVISRFPFYGAEDDEPEEVAAQIGAELNEIDPVTQSHNGFWETFLDDLAMGDYSTEEVLGDF